jgi:F-type H+-transporting ATPase subunit epsilon
MSRSLQLKVTTPFQVLVDTGDVRMVRAEDASGNFGILPGHADFLSVLPVSILRWRDANDRLHFCALRNGVFTVSGGVNVAVACRQGILGDDLPMLAAEVTAFQEEQADAERRARTGEMRMHARAMRELVSLLSPQRANGHGDLTP